MVDSIYDWTRSVGYKAGWAYLNVGEHATIPTRQRPGIKSIGYSVFYKELGPDSKLLGWLYSASTNDQPTTP